ITPAIEMAIGADQWIRLCRSDERHDRSTPDSRRPFAPPKSSESGRFCCKSRKSPGDNFPAKGRRDRRPSISVLSIALPRSPVSLRSGDEVPRIFTRKSRLQPREFLISSAKRLLQQHRPEAAYGRKRYTAFI